MENQPNPLVERAAAFINLANEQARASGNDQDQVAGSLMLATARYCAHVTAGTTPSALAMTQDRNVRIDFIVQNFRTLLEGEYDFYTDQFDELVLGANSQG